MSLKKQNTQGKSYQIRTSEFQKMLNNAVKSALKGRKNEEQDAFEKGDDDEDETKDDTAVTTEEIVDTVLECLDEKRKSRKEEGDGSDEITEQDVAEAVAMAVEGLIAEDEMKEDGEDGEEKDDTPDDEEKDEDEETEGKRRKSASSKRQVKRRTSSPIQRKYSNIFLSNSSGISTPRQKKQANSYVQLARAVKCYDVYGNHDPEKAAYCAKKFYNDSDMAREFKALSATNPVAGGYLIPEVYLDQIIEMLYAKTVVFELGAQKVPMSNGNLTIPKQTAGARAIWGSESRKIGTTQPQFASIRLSAKRLQAMIPQTRELMLSTNFSADQIFANDLVRRMELGIDFGALYGTGGEFQPTGLRYHTEIEHIDAKKIGNPDISDNTGKITADFPVYVTSKVLEKNVDDQKLGWAFNSAMEGYFKNMKTTTGAYIYREEMNSGKLLGFEYKVTNQIPTGKDGTTEIFFGNWADLLCGEQLGLETYTTLDGSWTDENGVQHNAFEENLSATRALMYLDLAARHTESFLTVHNIKVR